MGNMLISLVLIPRKNVDSPAIVVELKYNRDADTAISQIKRKNYPEKVAQYVDNLLLVGINYDRETKQHECHIENTFFPSTLNPHPSSLNPHPSSLNPHPKWFQPTTPSR